MHLRPETAGDTVICKQTHLLSGTAEIQLLFAFSFLITIGAHWLKGSGHWLKALGHWLKASDSLAGLQQLKATG